MPLLRLLQASNAEPRFDVRDTTQLVSTIPSARATAGVSYGFLGLRWLEPVALTDCSDLQMQRRVFRMAAILNQVLLRFMGSPNSNHD